MTRRGGGGAKRVRGLALLLLTLSAAHAAPAGEPPPPRLVALIERAGGEAAVRVRLPVELSGEESKVHWALAGPRGDDTVLRRGRETVLSLAGEGEYRVVWHGGTGARTPPSQPLRFTLRGVSGGAIGARTDVLRGKRWALSALPGDARFASTPEFVQLYIGTRPLSPSPAPLSTAGSAVLTAVTLSSTTTSGTLLTLEKVLENGQFFFPHEVLRRYTIQLSASASRQILLGDPGTVFVNPEVLGSPMDVLAVLGNRTVPLATREARATGCALGRGHGALSAPLLLALPFLPLLMTGRRRSRSGRAVPDSVAGGEL